MDAAEALTITVSAEIVKSTHYKRIKMSPCNWGLFTWQKLCIIPAYDTAR